MDKENKRGDSSNTIMEPRKQMASSNWLSRQNNDNKTKKMEMILIVSFRGRLHTQLSWFFHHNLIRVQRLAAPVLLNVKVHVGLEREGMIESPHEKQWDAQIIFFYPVLWIIDFSSTNQKIEDLSSRQIDPETLESWHQALLWVKALFQKKWFEVKPKIKWGYLYYSSLSLLPCLQIGGIISEEPD